MWGEKVSRCYLTYENACAHQCNVASHKIVIEIDWQYQDMDNIYAVDFIRAFTPRPISYHERYTQKNCANEN